MTTANPQPVSPHPDSSDDLIAELARLMAQDTAPRETAPTSSAAPRPASLPAAPKSAAPAVAPTIRIPGDPPMAAVQPPASSEKSDPFDFDFGITASPQPVAAPPLEPVAEPKPLAAVRVPQSLSPPAPEPVSVAPSVAPDIEPVAAAEDDDPIAALIAAELDSTFARPEPAPAPAAKSAPSAAAPRPERPVIATTAPPPVAAEPVFARASSPAPEARKESDRFATTPVFGLPSRPSAPPAALDDPMSEIEGLIGQAVRVELAPQSAKPAAAPPPARLDAEPMIVPHTPDIHRPASGRSSPSTSIDDTILAAAAATGISVDILDEEPSLAPPASEKRQRALPKVGMPKLAMPKVAIPKVPKIAMPVGRRQRAEAVEADGRRGGALRPLIGLGVAVGLFAIAGVGLWSVLGLGQPSGDAPVLTADGSPVKEAAPEPATPDPASTNRSVVFDEMAASPGAAPTAEQLVSRDQADGTEATQLAAANGEGDAALASRKVRTITVRPDGTIVSSDAAVAGAEVLPIERPNVPQLPAPDQEAQEMLAALRQPEAAGRPSSALALAEPGAPVATPAPAPVETPAPAAAGTPITAVSSTGERVPFPMPRPAGRQYVAAVNAPVTAVVEDAQETGAVEPPPPQREANIAPAPAASSSEGSASAYVQLSSQRSEEAARSSANAITRRYGSLFGGRGLEIQRVDLGERGVYYRVRLPAGSLSEAARICNSVKANGGDCFALNG